MKEQTATQDEAVLPLKRGITGGYCARCNNSWICRLLGHDWRWAFYKGRRCDRCGLEEG